MVYQPKLLEIDLAGRDAVTAHVDEEWVRDFIGGRGLGARMLWSRQAPLLDPLDPGAEVYLLTGPLTGVAPGGAQLCIVFKSPETEVTIGHSLTGANWAAELRAAGWDGVILRGQSPDPVYIQIKNDQVAIRDARHLWGMGTFETEVALKREVKDPSARVLSIGSAGENLVRFASVQQEFFRSAARGGAGAVWGSKRLKGIVVRGTNPVFPSRSDRVSSDRLERAFSARREIEKNLTEARSSKRRGYYLTRWGSSMSLVPHSDIAELDVKNYREAYWVEIDRVGGLAYEERVRARSRSCFGCPLGCMQLGAIKKGPYAGKLVNPDFDSTGTIGPGLLVTDLEAMVYLSRWADDLGLDAASLGNVTGFAMECYEKGLLTSADLDGIDLRWGKVKAIQALWEKIVRREGIGDLLAGGVRGAAQAIGRGSLDFAMQVKGLEFAGYAPQAHPDRGLQYAVGDRGACHHYGLTVAEQNHRAMADSLTVCTWHRAMISPDLYLQLLNAVTDWGYTLDEWEPAGERILLMARAYNIREGMVPARDDVLPERVHRDALTRGKKTGAVYSREQFLADRAAWYAERGCDEAGLPGAERLKQRRLGFLVPYMEEARATSNG